MAKLSRTNTFDFVGNITFPELPMSDKKLNETSKWNKLRIAVGIKDNQNAQYLTMENLYNPALSTVKIFDTVQEKMVDVNANDTTKKEVIERTPFYARIVFDMETDEEVKKSRNKLASQIRNIEQKEDKTEEDKAKLVEYKAQYSELATKRIEFAHMKDAIVFLNATLPQLKDKKIRVKGNIKVNFHKGKSNLQYIPSLFELVADETPNQLKAFVDYFYDKECLYDDTKERKFFANGYIMDKANKVEKLFPLPVVIDYTKLNDEDDTHKMLLNMFKGIFKITDKKMVHKMGIELSVINGRETKEFDESCLTEQQKMSIALGMNKLEDFKPKGLTFGDRVQELKVVKGDWVTYAEGSVEAFAVKELDEYLASDDSDKKVSEVKKEEPVAKEEPDMNSLMANLFG